MGLFKICFVLGLLIPGSVFCDLIKDLGKLKTGRTYTHVNVVSELGHNFEVTFKDESVTDGNPWRTVQVTAPAIDPSRFDLKPLEKRANSDELVELPKRLIGVKKDVKGFVLSKYPHSQVYQVRFLGTFAQVVLRQITPLALKIEGSERRYRTYRGKLRIHDNGKYRISDISMYAMIPANVFLYMEDGQRNYWLDFNAPDELEGSAVLDLSLFEKAEGWDFEQYETLQKSLIVSCLSSLKKQKNDLKPIDAIVDEQDTGVLPSSSQQFYRAAIEIRGMGGRENYQLISTLVFIIPVTDEEIVLKQKDEKSGFIVRMVGRLTGIAKGFTYSVTEPDGIEVDSWSDLTTYKASIIEDELGNNFLTGIHFLRTEQEATLPGDDRFEYYMIKPHYDFRLYPFTKAREPFSERDFMNISALESPHLKQTSPAANNAGPVHTKAHVPSPVVLK